jgi:hypothetical protein
VTLTEVVVLLGNFDLEIPVLVIPYPFNVDLEALELKTLVVPLVVLLDDFDLDV